MIDSETLESPDKEILAKDQHYVQSDESCVVSYFDLVLFVARVRTIPRSYTKPHEQNHFASCNFVDRFTMPGKSLK